MFLTISKWLIAKSGLSIIKISSPTDEHKYSDVLNKLGILIRQFTSLRKEWSMSVSPILQVVYCGLRKYMIDDEIGQLSS